MLGLDREVSTCTGFSAQAIDITDPDELRSVIQRFAPDECYHLAAHHRSSAATTEDALSEANDEREHIRVNLLATLRLLQLLREIRPSCRVFLAGSCHMFGAVRSSIQTESTPFCPHASYGITKVAAWHFAKSYRERGLLFCSMGILYNHESPRRASHFLSARIAQGVVDIVKRRTDHLVVGNLSAAVDWGFAGDYVDAMWRMLQHEEPDDFIVASGELHRVKDFVELAFEHVGLDWHSYVRQDSSVYRPVHDGVYHGDISKIRQRLGWTPTTSFKALVGMMVDDRLSRDERARG